MNKFLFLLLILVLAIGLPFLFRKTNRTYTKRDLNYTLDGANGEYHAAQTDILVNTYPPIGKNQITDNTASDIWWHYPTFELGSYEQITNNIRYPNNPDLGRCMPASMCGTLYKDNQLKSNYIEQLPPMNPDCGTRIGYFDTNANLLHFRTNTQNILY